MEIHVIFTGGTIGSRLHGEGIGTDSNAPHELLQKYKEATGDETVFPAVVPYTILSENLKFYHITMLANCIREEAKKCDALIVTHGTDTLPFTAVALSYILGNEHIPVVLVSSNYILSDERANGVKNFLAAVNFLRSQKDARGVYVSYRNNGEHTKIFRGARLLAHLPPTDDVHALGGALAVQKNKVFHTVPGYTEKSDAQPPISAEGLEEASERVLFLRAHPRMVYPDPDPDCAAVLIETYHSGTLCTASSGLKRFADIAAARGLPVFLAGITGERVYESTDLYPSLGLIPLPRMSPVAAYMKLCLAIGNGLDPKTVLPLPLGGDME